MIDTSTEPTRGAEDYGELTRAWFNGAEQIADYEAGLSRERWRVRIAAAAIIGAVLASVTLVLVLV
jgi:hypothetical protein